MATKAQLRKTYTAKRQALLATECAALNLQLLEQFKKLALQEVGYVHIFRSIKDRNEPDTDAIIQWLKTSHRHITLVYPKANFTTGTMQGLADDDGLEMENNKFGIPEPLSGTLVDPAQIDVVIVPMLAYDKQGYRVGYGKGFYDRFLADCKPSAQFIGLSFFEPEEIIDDIDQHDIALHKCITPTSIIGFS